MTSHPDTLHALQVSHCSLVPITKNPGTTQTSITTGKIPADQVFHKISLKLFGYDVYLCRVPSYVFQTSLHLI